MGFSVSAPLSVFMLGYLLTAMVFTADSQDPYPMSLVVYNPVTTPVNLTYNTEIAFRGILLGAMRKIQKNNKTFTFTTKEDPDYGPFLVSVNGHAGEPAEHTYWQILVRLQNGTEFRTDVGVGCYIPNPYDTVILKFSKWTNKEVKQRSEL